MAAASAAVARRAIMRHPELSPRALARGLEEWRARCVGSLRGQLRYHIFCRVDMTQRLENGGGIDCDRATDAVIELVIPRECFEVAVEDDSHKFARPIDDRAAGVAADDVGSAHEIERRGSLDGRPFRG